MQVQLEHSIYSMAPNNEVLNHLKTLIQGICNDKSGMDRDIAGYQAALHAMESLGDVSDEVKEGLKGAKINAGSGKPTPHNMLIVDRDGEKWMVHLMLLMWMLRYTALGEEMKTTDDAESKVKELIKKWVEEKRTWLDEHEKCWEQAGKWIAEEKRGGKALIMLPRPDSSSA